MSSFLFLNSVLKPDSNPTSSEMLSVCMFGGRGRVGGGGPRLRSLAVSLRIKMLH